MKRHFNERYNETYYEEKLDNGLRVIVWHKPGFETSQFLFATPYGALDFCQQKEDESMVAFPSGIAHFLEHKMFEHQGIDVMERFSQLGANVNAFTSYNETVYYFSTTNKDVKEEVNLLLDFVQELSIE
ncbi:MAG: insulinase family protein, partial [Erysipelotrichaceae bacterium]|nr:insulinase family protein [Erysipelotrichaceae bacterium]